MSMEVFRGNYLKVTIKRYGEKYYEAVDAPDATAIVAIYDGKIILVDQYRPVLNRHTIELPAGLIENGEKPEDAIIRELEEETGYLAKDLLHLFTYSHAPGYSTGRTHLFYSNHLIKTRQLEREKIEVLTVSPKDALNLLRDGKIEDPNTLIGLNMLLGGLISPNDRFI
jgi:ADP-ribose pyrophosphatase